MATIGNGLTMTIKDTCGRRAMSLLPLLCCVSLKWVASSAFPVPVLKMFQEQGKEPGKIDCKGRKCLGFSSSLTCYNSCVIILSVSLSLPQSFVVQIPKPLSKEWF